MQKIAPLSKDFLQEQYINQNKLAKDIAKKTGYKKSLIHKWLHDYNLSKNNSYGNLVNQKFGKLLVIAKSCKKGIWYCICDCGTFASAKTKRLTYGKTRSCGCIQKEYAKYNNWNGFGEFDGALLTSIRNGAKKRNFVIEITSKYLWELYEKQERKCALSGIELFYASPKLRLKNKINNISIDRIDSKKGYIEGNIQLLHKDINQMKWDYSQKEFIQICNNIYDFQKFEISCVVESIPKNLNRTIWCGEIRKTSFTSLLRHAKDRNIQVAIKIEDLNILFLKQNKRCALSGVKLYFDGQSKNTTASLDRIDSLKGYEINNIQWIHKDINIIKYNLNQDYFLDLVYKIAEKSHKSS